MKMNDERLQRYYEAKRLREVEQKTLVQIGDELGISERSVRRLLAMKEPPQERIHRERKISLVEHEETIQKIINEYGENTSKIYVKLTEYGVKTSLRSVQRWMQENRGKNRGVFSTCWSLHLARPPKQISVHATRSSSDLRKGACRFV